MKAPHTFLRLFVWVLLLPYNHKNIATQFIGWCSAWGQESQTQTTKKTASIIQKVPQNSAEYDTLDRRLLLRLTNNSNSYQLVPTALHHSSKQDSHSDANASCGIANSPSYGRNCPRIPLTIPRPNCLVTSPNNSFACSLAGVHASATIAHVTARCIVKIANL